MTLSEKILNNSAYAEAYRQGGKDAIDKIYKHLIECKNDIDTAVQILNERQDFKYQSMVNAQVEINRMLFLADQIKEQKNE